jgi:hypothetical protein
LMLWWWTGHAPTMKSVAGCYVVLKLAFKGIKPFVMVQIWTSESTWLCRYTAEYCTKVRTQSLHANPWYGATWKDSKLGDARKWKEYELREVVLLTRKTWRGRSGGNRKPSPYSLEEVNENSELRM